MYSNKPFMMQIKPIPRTGESNTLPNSLLTAHVKDDKKCTRSTGNSILRQTLWPDRPYLRLVLVLQSLSLYAPIVIIIITVQ